MEPRVEVLTLWLPKDGNSESDYEDASNQREDRFFAVADGATETSFSGVWAKILTKAFVENRLPDLSQETLLPLVSEWNREIAELTQHVPLAWYAEEKLKKGAFSSLLGIKFGATKSWTCMFVGDSCLFQVRDGEICCAIPYKKPIEFHNHPALISTNTLQNEILGLEMRDGDWKYGDHFFLMTDALAECFLSNHDYESLEFFTSVRDPDEFQHKIQQLRIDNRCRNDDVTLIRIHIIPSIEDAKVDLA